MCSVCRSILADKTSRNLFFFLCLNLSFAFVELLYGIWSNRYRAGGAGRERLPARRKRRLPPRPVPRLPLGGAGLGRRGLGPSGQAGPPGPPSGGAGRQSAGSCWRASPTGSAPVGSDRLRQPLS